MSLYKILKLTIILFLFVIVIVKENKKYSLNHKKTLFFFSRTKASEFIDKNQTKSLKAKFFIKIMKIF